MARKGYDRIPIKHEGTPEVNKALMEYFGLANYEQLGSLYRARVEEELDRGRQRRARDPGLALPPTRPKR